MNVNGISFKSHVVIILVSLVSFGSLALAFGKEMHFDLLSYHYYSPYAFFYDRWNFDYWPSYSMQMYLNPVRDFLTFFLIHFFSPSTAIFLIGAIQGLNFWLLILINYFFLNLLEIRKKRLITFTLACVGIYCPIVIAEIGSFLGDNIISIFVLGAVYCYLKSRQENYHSSLFFSGFLLGVAVGLKLTAAMFAVGFLVASFTDRISFLKKIIIWILSCILGFLITSGYWMWILWKQFKSPLYPFYNALFKAPGFPPINWHDSIYFPEKIYQWILYPFFYLWNGRNLEGYYLDLRFPILYILLIVFVISYVIRKITKIDLKMNAFYYWFILFYFVSYLTWQCTFANLRYLMVLAMLAPLLIYLLIYFSFRNYYMKLSILFCTFFYLVVTLQPLQAEKIHKIGKNYFAVSLPTYVYKERNSLVLMTCPTFCHSHVDPMLTLLKTKWNYGPTISSLSAYLIPFFPANWRFVALPIVQQHFAVTPQIRSFIDNQNNKIYLLASRSNLKPFYQAAFELKLQKNGECSPIQTDALLYGERSQDGILLCPLRKIVSIQEMSLTKACP